MSIMRRIRDLKYRLKCAWQRATRGYDDQAKWGLASTIADMAIPCLEAMRDNGHSYRLGDTPESWKEKLDKMRHGFECYKALYDNYDLTPGTHIYVETKRQYKEGLKLFIKHYQDLWD